MTQGHKLQNKTGNNQTKKSNQDKNMMFSEQTKLFLWH